jgi:hypothetical protein
METPMHRRAPLALAAVLALAPGLAAPAAADEIAETIEQALGAYRGGDTEGARADLEYAVKLLTELKAASLATFLPAAPAGWTRTDAEADGAGIAMAMFGGGTAAAATYTRGAETITLTLLGNSPMVSGMAAMVSGMASMTGGKTERINRTEFAVSEGEVQGVIDGKVLVRAEGTAPASEMTALIRLLDFPGLAAF